MEETAAVKIPIYNPINPPLWFVMCEETFALAAPKPITDSKTKFNNCVAHLPPEITALVRDIFLRERTDASYEDLKAAITVRCGESSTSEIRKLLTGEQLGDRKPSELLRVMTRRAEKYNVLPDSLLLELFMHQMPPNVQSILASVEPLDSSKASSIADRILEVTPAQVSEVSSCVPLNVSEISKLDSLLEEVSKLRSEVFCLYDDHAVFPKIAITGSEALQLKLLRTVPIVGIIIINLAIKLKSVFHHVHFQGNVPGKV
ncbi:uncharacterized protein LOC118190280 [Stegodyphus dumicola]|uniref:uncharacterized protein LOC118190280 n=1 Tax=Stegodyphus dumicola TaxID=202533 RepID=UPI0015A7FB20|nr:uncharacterized protein LOC118190280 [Stegodyphus dumicola]